MGPTCSAVTPTPHTHTCSPVPPPALPHRTHGRRSSNQPPTDRLFLFVCLYLSPPPRLRLRVRRGAPPATSQSCRADKPSLPESENRISEIPIRHPPSALGSPIRTRLPSLPLEFLLHTESTGFRGPTPLLTTGARGHTRLGSSGPAGLADSWPFLVHNPGWVSGVPFPPSGLRAAGGVAWKANRVFRGPRACGGGGK